MARQSGFLQRKSKVKPEEFIDMLMFSEFNQSELSLQDCCNDLAQQHQASLSKVGLFKRFNGRTLNFVKLLLARQMSLKIGAVQGKNWDAFARVVIGDSSKFVLPKKFMEDYPGYGSFGKESSIMNIQYAFDIKNGDWGTLELTKATQNDQSHSKKIDDICENELHIRDLGFVTKPYLLKIAEAKAFYLNRMNPQWGFVACDTKKQTDFTKLHQEMKQGQRKCFETDITVTVDKKTFDCRMIAIAVPEEVYAERVRKAQQRAKNHGKSISDEYKARCRFSIYVTNTGREKLKAEDIPELYRLRWQIELIFKTWKSVLGIHKVKAVKKERMECLLIIKFIWILLNWKIFHVTDAFVQKHSPAYGCSQWKFFKLARHFGHALRKVIKNIISFKEWCEEFICPAIKNLLIDDRKGKKAGYQIVNEVFNPLG